MHDYSIDKHPKEKVLFFLAFFAIVAAPKIKELVDSLILMLEANTGWSSAPVVAVPVFALFAGLYFLFDKYLWKISWLRKLLLVPDLNGKWICKGCTNLKNAEVVHYDWEAIISITQSWSKIFIHLKTNHSESKSISASIYHEDGVGYRLLYQYNNRPNVDEPDLSIHSGTAELLFSEDTESASGFYYTDKHRTTVGTMSLTRKK